MDAPNLRSSGIGAVGYDYTGKDFLINYSGYYYIVAFLT